MHNFTRTLGPDTVNIRASQLVAAEKSVLKQKSAKISWGKTRKIKSETSSLSWFALSLNRLSIHISHSNVWSSMFYHSKNLLYSQALLLRGQLFRFLTRTWKTGMKSSLNLFGNFNLSFPSVQNYNPNRPFEFLTCHNRKRTGVNNKIYDWLNSI